MSERLDSRHPEQAALAAPAHPALIMADSGQILTYRDLTEKARHMVGVFAAHGLQTGDTIACLLPNGPELFVTAWAAKNSGLRYVIIGTRLNAADVDYILRDCGARLLVCHDLFASVVLGLGYPKSAVPAIVAGPSNTSLPSTEDINVEQYGETAMPRRRGASMLYSSGTTGKPKGIAVVLPDAPPEEPPARHALLMANYGLSADSVFITAAPLYHAGPLRIAMAVQRAGGTVVSFAKFGPADLLDAIEQYRATHGFFVPTMFQRMLDLDESVRSKFDLSSIRHAIHGAAPCPPEVKKAMIAWWGPVIDELYGGTESIGQTFISSAEWLEHPGSVGKPQGRVEVKIVDGQGCRMPAGEIGRVMMRNPQRFAYHGAAAGGRQDNYDAEGYATLGDRGYLDSDGYLYLTDRESNMIISGGVNIYPQEAESVLAGHPAILDAAVVGVPDRDLGEVPRCVIVLREGVDASPALAKELLQYCRERLSRYKCPRDLVFADALPRNELGKLVKRLIPESLLTQIA